MDSLNAYYKGGFEEQMSKREAGLILGCRYGVLCLVLLERLMMVVTAPTRHLNVSKTLTNA
jgi:hypothetical protein